jgi:hypothetical protein
MAPQIDQGRGSIVVRQSAFERAGLVRSAIDARYNLTDAEFNVADGLVIIGPLPADDMIPQLIEDLEGAGLNYFDDFFELSGNWPEWLSLYVRGAKERPT